MTPIWWICLLNRTMLPYSTLSFSSSETEFRRDIRFGHLLNTSCPFRVSTSAVTLHSGLWPKQMSCGCWLSSTRITGPLYQMYCRPSRSSRPRPSGARHGSAWNTGSAWRVCRAIWRNQRTSEHTTPVWKRLSELLRLSSRRHRRPTQTARH